MLHIALLFQTLALATPDVHVGLITYAPVPGGWERNIGPLDRAVREAVAGGARIVVLPELAVTGSLAGLTTVAAETLENGPTVAHWARVSKELNVWMAVPFLEIARAGNVEMAIALIDPRGRVAMVQHKTLVRMGREDGPVSRASFREMQDSVVANGIRIGVVSGDDLRVGVARLSNRGADLVLVPTGWTSADAEPWRKLSEQLATENHVAIAAASREPDSEFNGVFSPRRHQSTRASGEHWMVVAVPLQARRWLVESALGLPSSVPLPSVDPGSDAMAALGMRLFFDKNLSATGKVACATCHDPAKSFTNGKAKGEGVYGRTTKRNVPTLLNVAFRPLLQWDGYASTLENFAKYPISGVTEMNFHYVDKVAEYLHRQPSYVREFASAMGVKKIEFDHVAKALGAYQRTLISGESPFDRHYYRDEAGALDAPAKRGLALFQGKANCAQCHRVEPDAALFMDFRFHVTGHGYDPKTGVFSDIGLGSISTDEQTGLFQTPSLRNVAETAPYMHDGGLTTLEAVVDFYNRGGTPNPRLDPAIRPLGLTADERRDLVAFLRSLTGAQQYYAPGPSVKARK